MDIPLRKVFLHMAAMILKTQLHQDNSHIYYQSFQTKTFCLVNVDFLHSMIRKAVTKMAQQEFRFGEN